MIRQKLTPVAGKVFALGALALASTGLAATEARAQTLDAPTGVTGGGRVANDAAPSDDWGFTLGIGAGIAPDYEGSEDYDPVPIPLARVDKSHRFGQLLGAHVTSNLINHPNWRLGPSANYRRGLTEAGDNRVDALKNRGSSFELGVIGGYVFQFDELILDNARLDLSLEFLQDVSSGHEGFVVTPSITYSAPLATSWNLSVGAETAIASGNYMSHYFSINSDDAADSGLQNYDADGDFKHVGLNLAVGYEITQRWSLSLLGQGKLMVGDAEDSPVVDDAGEDWQGFAGFVVSYGWGGGR